MPTPGGPSRTFGGTQATATSTFPAALTSSVPQASGTADDRELFRFFHMTAAEQVQWSEGASKQSEMSHRWSEIQANRIGLCTGSVVDEVRKYLHDLKAAWERLPRKYRPYDSVFMDDLINRTARDFLADSYDRNVKILAPFDPQGYAVPALLSALSQEYLGVAEVQTLRSDLGSLTQGDSTVADYSRRFYAHQAQAYEQPSAAEQEEITNQFLFGLKSERMRHKILDQGVGGDLTRAVNLAVKFSSEDAYKEALKVKYGRGRIQTVKRGRASLQPAAEAMDTSPIDLAAIESIPLREKLAEQDRKFNALLKKMEALTSPHSGKEAQSGKKGNKSNNKRKTDGPKKYSAPQKSMHCFVCGDPDHIAPRCPKKVEKPTSSSTIASADPGN